MARVSFRLKEAALLIAFLISLAFFVSHLFSFSPIEERETIEIVIPKSLGQREEPKRTRKVRESEEKCVPQQNVAFAKSHKTGSSTLQNIILRYGIRHDLNFAFPKDSWYFKLKAPMNASDVLDGPWKELGTFNIFAAHSQWRKKEVQKILPSDAKYVTILRDPVNSFESNYVYMGLQNMHKMDINEFAEKKIPNHKERTKGDGNIGKNQHLWDLGLPVEDLEDVDEVKKKILEVEEEFDLVMMSEHFDESMILMKGNFFLVLSSSSEMIILQNYYAGIRKMLHMST